MNEREIEREKERMDRESGGRDGEREEDEWRKNRDRRMRRINW